MDGSGLSKSDWTPARLNAGWRYFHKINKEYNGDSLLRLLTRRYSHSSHSVWKDRLYSGKIWVNNKQVNENLVLNTGDIICWDRPPWEEPAIPTKWNILFDDGDLFIINKPAGLPVLPGGGYLTHTLSELLRLHFQGSNNSSIPKPVHRLGRFTSGILICARKKESRAKLSSIFRRENEVSNNCRKIYRALVKPNHKLKEGEPITINIPICQFSHPFLGKLWNAERYCGNDTPSNNPIGKRLNALSTIKLLERRKNSDLLEVAITTGRPHQIRIHLAAIGTPLVGDPLYGPEGLISNAITPGAGGYLLHAHQLLNISLRNEEYSFTALPPEILKTDTEKP